MIGRSARALSLPPMQPRGRPAVLLLLSWACVGGCQKVDTPVGSGSLAGFRRLQALGAATAAKARERGVALYRRSKNCVVKGESAFMVALRAACDAEKAARPVGRTGPRTRTRTRATRWPIHMSAGGSREHGRDGEDARPYVLELSGAFRTLGITWHMLLQNLILPNGGLDAWRICIVARTEHPEEREIGNYIASALKAHYVNFEPHNHSFNCQLYGFPPDCFFGEGQAAGKFPLQWASVMQAHHHCLRGASRSALYVRLRPDSLLFEPVHLARTRERLVRNGTAIVPCKIMWPTAKIEGLTDQVVVGSREAMASYANFPIRSANGKPQWSITMEHFVAAAVGKKSPFFEAYNQIDAAGEYVFGPPMVWKVALLRMSLASSLVYDGNYRAMLLYDHRACSHDIGNPHPFHSPTIVRPKDKLYFSLTHHAIPISDTVAQTMVLIQKYAGR